MEQYKEHQDQKITRQNFISYKTGGTYDMSLLFYTFLFCYLLSKFVLEIWLCLIKCICHICAILEDIIQSNSCKLCIDGRIGRRMRFKTCDSIFNLFQYIKWVVLEILYILVVRVVCYRFIGPYRFVARIESKKVRENSLMSRTFLLLNVRTYYLCFIIRYTKRAGKEIIAKNGLPV